MLIWIVYNRQIPPVSNNHTHVAYACSENHGSSKFRSVAHWLRNLMLPWFSESAYLLTTTPMMVQLYTLPWCSANRCLRHLVNNTLFKQLIFSYTHLLNKLRGQFWNVCTWGGAELCRLLAESVIYVGNTLELILTWMHLMPQASWTQMLLNVLYLVISSRCSHIS